ncbi:MAG: bifunctional folylpolyglutamate synthase/dihydrofolate synthase, partial [Oscillospiraceae bacterium]|nr:bifunctional folylpolyglutamate synthase/dihydrofolate synthase [Oscillospiraceae bacterium]
MKTGSTNSLRGNHALDISETLKYIDSYKNDYPHEDLSRVRDLLTRLGDPDRKLRFVHVAGTNGKGSTCAMLASILRKAGYRTGLFTSPHILRYNERMQIDGSPITDDDLIRATEKVRAAIDGMENKVNWFEMVMCTALVWFAEKEADIVVFEVGLGGYLDGTNVIDVPECAVITNIGLDHTEILGDTLEEIAWQKAAIIKAGGTAVVYRGPEQVEKVFEDRCREVGAELIKADFDSISEGSADVFGQTFDAEGMKNIRIPLAGEHQRKNAAVAICAARALRSKGWKITGRNIRSGLRYTVWPVRFEVVSKEPLFIIDGGHNPQCAEAVRDSLRDLIPSGTKIVYLLGMLADKDFRDVIRILGSVSGEFVTVTPDSYRALDAAELARCIEDQGFSAVPCSSVAEGIETAIRLAGGGAVCCVGSLYLAGSVRRHFSPDPGFRR